PEPTPRSFRQDYSLQDRVSIHHMTHMLTPNLHETGVPGGKTPSTGRNRQTACTQHRTLNAGSARQQSKPLL
ncbi:Ras guanine nucleotide exchange factor Y, partial [Clarias magur]